MLDSKSTIHAGRITEISGDSTGLRFSTTIPESESVLFDSETVGVVFDDGTYGNPKAIKFAERFQESEYVSHMTVEQKSSGSLQVDGV